MNTKKPSWNELRTHTSENLAIARQVLEEVRLGKTVTKAVRRHPLSDGGDIGKHLLVAVYRQLVEKGEWPADTDLLARIRLKPVRTLSGVTTVTVLTKPYPCPGKCIFCPTDVRTPKSYLPDATPVGSTEIDLRSEPCAQWLDVIPEGTLGPGTYTYLVRLMGPEGEIARAERRFVAVASAPPAGSP